MHISHKRMLLIGALSLFAVGCSQPESPAGDAHKASGSEPASTSAVDGVTFQMKPVRLPCTARQAPLAVDISWSAGSNVKVWAQGPGESAPKLWTEGGASGHKGTGNWVQVGTRFFLRDAATSKPLATLTAESDSGCAAGV